MSDPSALPDIPMPITCEEDFRRGEQRVHEMLRTKHLTEIQLDYLESLGNALCDWEEAHPVADSASRPPSPSLQYFLEFARNKELDTDLRHACALLAENTCHSAQHLDDIALLGFAEFLSIARSSPDEARRLIQGD